MSSKMFGEFDYDDYYNYEPDAEWYEDENGDVLND